MLLLIYEKEEKYGKGSIVIIIILGILVVFLGGYIFLNTNNNDNEKNSTNGSDNKVVVENTEEGKNSEEVNFNNNNYVKTRTCIGVYRGNAALTQNVQTGEYDQGTLTIELKADGTYELQKENMNGDSGAYTIIDNALLLKTAPHICGPDNDCSASYSQYLNISEDCSKISWGYGSYFFEPNFTLNKQN